MFASIGEGFYLVTSHAATKFKNDTPLIAKRISKTVWGLFEIAASDLVQLQLSIESGKAIPPLQSLRSVCIGRTRCECMDNLIEIGAK